jgi:hypothetical protein
MKDFSFIHGEIQLEKYSKIGFGRTLTLPPERGIHSARLPVRFLARGGINSALRELADASIAFPYSLDSKLARGKKLQA